MGETAGYVTSFNNLIQHLDCDQRIIFLGKVFEQPLDQIIEHQIFVLNAVCVNGKTTRSGFSNSERDKVIVTFLNSLLEVNQDLSGFGTAIMAANKDDSDEKRKNQYMWADQFMSPVKVQGREKMSNLSSGISDFDQVSEKSDNDRKCTFMKTYCAFRPSIQVAMSKLDNSKTDFSRELKKSGNQLFFKKFIDNISDLAYVESYRTLPVIPKIEKGGYLSELMLTELIKIANDKQKFLKFINGPNVQYLFVYREKKKENDKSLFLEQLSDVEFLKLLSAISSNLEELLLDEKFLSFFHSLLRLLGNERMSTRLFNDNQRELEEFFTVMNRVAKNNIGRMMADINGTRCLVFYLEIFKSLHNKLPIIRGHLEYILPFIYGEYVKSNHIRSTAHVPILETVFSHRLRVKNENNDSMEYVCPELLPKATNFLIDHLSAFGMQFDSNAIDVFDQSAFRLLQLGQILLRYQNVPGNQIFTEKIVERLNYVADVNPSILRYLVSNEFVEDLVPKKFENESFMTMVRRGRLDSDKKGNTRKASKKCSKKSFNNSLKNKLKPDDL